MSDKTHTNEVAAGRINSLVEHGYDLQKRTVNLFGTIDFDLFRRFYAALLVVDETPGDIVVKMYSGGGDVEAGFACYDAIRATQNQVTILGIGEVQSIAAIVLQSGDRRILAPSASFMIHDPYFPEGVEGDVRAGRAVVKAEEIKADTDRYHRVLAERSGASLRTIRKMCTEQRVFLAPRAVRVGLADELMELRPQPAVNT